MVTFETRANRTIEDTYYCNLEPWVRVLLPIKEGRSIFSYSIAHSIRKLLKS